VNTPSSPRHCGFTLLEVLLAISLLAGLSLILVAGFFLVVRGQGFTIGTNDNTNKAGQIMNRIVHGVGSHRPMREAVRDTAFLSPSGGGGWTMEYEVNDAVGWIRYNPRTRQIFNNAGRVLGDDVIATGAVTNYAYAKVGGTVVDSIDLWLTVQTANNGRALTETVSTRIQFRNMNLPD
jgi:prepilin-type N-terminal cleavage/methylation domain-containing protein